MFNFIVLKPLKNNKQITNLYKCAASSTKFKMWLVHREITPFELIQTEQTYNNVMWEKSFSAP